MYMNIDGKELAMEGCGSNVTETGDLGTLPQSVCTTPLFGAKAILAGAAVFGRVCQTIHDSNAQNKDECFGRFNCSSGLGLQIGLDIQVFGFGTCLVAGWHANQGCQNTPPTKSLLPQMQQRLRRIGNHLQNLQLQV